MADLAPVKPLLVLRPWPLHGFSFPAGGAPVTLSGGHWSPAPYKSWKGDPCQHSARHLSLATAAHPLSPLRSSPPNRSNSAGCLPPAPSTPPLASAGAPPSTITA